MKNNVLTSADTDGKFVYFETRGSFTLPNGARYDIDRLQHEVVIDPASGRASRIYTGFATAEDESLANADVRLIDELRGKPQQSRELLPGASIRPLEIKLMPHGEGQYTGIFWNVHGEWAMSVYPHHHYGSPPQFNGTIVRRDSEFDARLQRNSRQPLARNSQARQVPQP